MTQNPYRKECNELKSAIREGFELAQVFRPDYTKTQFLEIVKKDLHDMKIKANGIIRSGGHPEEALRIAILAQEDLVFELEKEIEIK